MRHGFCYVYDLFKILVHKSDRLDALQKSGIIVFKN